MADAANAISVELTHAEALVLFEWLVTHDEDQEDQKDCAETRVLWKIEGALERIFVEPLRPDYARLLEDARREVMGS